MKEIPRHLQIFVLQIHHKNDIQDIRLQLRKNMDSIKRQYDRVSALAYLDP